MGTKVKILISEYEVIKTYYLREVSEKVSARN